MKHVLFFILLFMTSMVNANNMLVQNVTTLGNDAVNKTIQVQFDISWDNSWRDEINYDAAWIFMKFKNASGVWQHVQLNQTGFMAGTGTANTVQVTNDKVGSWLYRSGLGSGTFTSTSMQLQWNYGLSGLTSVIGLEVRVFAVEMVYVPEGEFNCAKNYTPYIGNYTCYAPAGNVVVINNRLSPTISLFDGTSFDMRIKGGVGTDYNNDGIIENTSYPTGYSAFYCLKYQLSEQQYTDFLNTLTQTQVANVGIAGISIFSNDGQYFSSNPNLGCKNGNSLRLFSFGDWSGLRPMSFWEYNKAMYGPIQPVLGTSNIGSFEIFTAGGQYFGFSSVPEWGGSGNSTRGTSDATFYGIMQMTAAAKEDDDDNVNFYNTMEPAIKPSGFNFSGLNGDGVISSTGESDVLGWQDTYVFYLEQASSYEAGGYGFRFVRSAE